MEELICRRAVSGDLDRICDITEQAKKSLLELGTDQWQQGYPNRGIWEEDIRIGRAFVLEDTGRVLAAYTYLNTEEKSYNIIEGEWLTGDLHENYASLHRVCVDIKERGKGLAGRIFEEGYRKAKEEGLLSVRIDTHPGNIPMQHALNKSGYAVCGNIILAEGAEAGHGRIAYEKIIE